MAKRKAKDAVSRKISREERKKVKGKRKSRDQIVAQGINMARRGKRGQ